MAKSKPVKANAAVFVAENRQQADETVRTIGELQRKRESLQTAMNAEIAAVKERYEADAAPVGETIKALGHGVQVWAEANRAELTKNGSKTVKLGNGELRWRTRPPSVTVRAAGIVIEALKRLGLQRLIRTKEEINKEAILADPDAVRDVKGISISQGEDFVIVPLATELEEVAS